MSEQKKKIMVATDGSKASENAVRYAAQLSKRRGTTLILFHAISYKKVGYWGFIDKHFKKELRAAAGKILDEAEKIAKDFDVPFERMVREDEKLPHVIIADALEELKNIWVLVVGDKGTDLQERHAFGSTTHGVLHELSKRALPVPILVVPYVKGVELTV